MSLFTGRPNSGYLCQLSFNSGSGAVVLPCDTYDYDTQMDWQEANVFNPDGLKDHSKGLSGGVVTASGIWDTGLNVQSNNMLGTQGTLVYSVNSSDGGSCAQAKVQRWHIHGAAPGQVRFDVAFIIDGTWTDLSGDTANYPTVAS